MQADRSYRRGFSPLRAGSWWGWRNGIRGGRPLSADSAPEAGVVGSNPMPHPTGRCSVQIKLGGAYPPTRGYVPGDDQCFPVLIDVGGVVFMPSRRLPGALSDGSRALAPVAQEESNEPVIRRPLVQIQSGALEDNMTGTTKVAGLTVHCKLVCLLRQRHNGVWSNTYLVEVAGFRHMVEDFEEDWQ